MYPDRFTPCHFGLAADRAAIHLAVQTRGGLIGEQMQRMASRLLTAEPFGRLQPGGMSGAIVVAKRINRLGKDFDAA